MRTTALLLLKRGFHHCVSCELVNDQSLVYSCNQNPGSHAKHNDKLVKKHTLWTLESRFMCTDKYCTVFRMGQSGGTATSRALIGKNTNT